MRGLPFGLGAILLVTALLNPSVVRANADKSVSPVFCSFVFEEVGGEAYWSALDSFQTKVDATATGQQVLRPFQSSTMGQDHYALCADMDAPKKTMKSLKPTLYVYASDEPISSAEGCQVQASEKVKAAKVSKTLKPGTFFGIEFNLSAQKRTRFSMHWLTKNLQDGAQEICRKLSDEMSSSGIMDGFYSKQELKTL